jgi:hypothetical protein
MDSELVQALTVLVGVLVESGLFYVVVGKVWKSSRLEAALMAIGLTLLFCAAAWLCRWGSEIRWSVLFWAGWLGFCWVCSLKKWFSSVPSGAREGMR